MTVFVNNNKYVQRKRPLGDFIVLFYVAGDRKTFINASDYVFEKELTEKELIEFAEENEKKYD